MTSLCLGRTHDGCWRLWYPVCIGNDFLEGMAHLLLSSRRFYFLFFSSLVSSLAFRLCGQHCSPIPLLKKLVWEALCCGNQSLPGKREEQRWEGGNDRWPGGSLYVDSGCVTLRKKPDSSKQVCLLCVQMQGPQPSPASPLRGRGIGKTAEKMEWGRLVCYAQLSISE